MKRKDLLAGLSEEQIAKIKACKSNDELLKLAQKEGIELTPEQLEAVSGGACSSSKNKHKKIDSNEKNPLNQPF